MVTCCVRIYRTYGFYKGKCRPGLCGRAPKLVQRVAIESPLPDGTAWFVPAAQRSQNQTQVVLLAHGLLPQQHRMDNTAPIYATVTSMAGSMSPSARGSGLERPKLIEPGQSGTCESCSLGESDPKFLPQNRGQLVVGS